MVTVSSGEKVICSACAKVIKSDIKTQTVLATDLQKYSVREIKETCPVCEAKIEKQRRLDEIRKIKEQTRARRQQFVGQWVKRTGLGDAIITINSDGTADWIGIKTRLTFTSDGFTALVYHQEGTNLYANNISGQMTESGKIIVKGWSALWGFSKNEEDILERL